MPAIIGPLQILNIGGGVIQFGDAAIVAPKSSTKSTGGSGGFNTGPFHVNNNGFSLNQTFDINGIDQPIVGPT
ncbi:spore germination protein GerPF [Jeotgalibacillus soli]|uniref:Spore germination protein GerPF n=1 Tax=Jeotgalibacillus soli TaxID=889306 RepID=A0A0C2V9L0_9BACL|nr:spore germination protein [Jeotgalibacillus soli]KIL45642.1 spore germination protein GerPF [Jeotgalibacillus soli]